MTDTGERARAGGTRGAKALAAILLLATLALPACRSQATAEPKAGVDKEGAPEPDPISVQVGAVAREPVSSLYTTSTTLRAEREAVVIARTRGVIRQLQVEEGDRVAEGQALATLEDDEQIIDAQRARTAAETRNREFDRVSKLHGEGLVSEEEFESARRETEDARQAVALAELTLSRTVIRAPFAGILLRRHLDVGATVADGTPVYDLADVSPLFADVNIPERNVGRLVLKQTARLMIDEESEPVLARIERIAPAVDPESGTVKVTLAVAGRARMRPGAFVRVAIVTDTHENALVVPRTALVAEGRRWHLYRRLEDDTVREIEVTLGYEEGDRVEIEEVMTEGETLDEGLEVVTIGAPALSDGAKIRVIGEGPQDEDESGEPGVAS